MALLSLLTKDGSDIETTNCGSFNPIVLAFIIFSFKRLTELCYKNTFFPSHRQTSCIILTLKVFIVTTLLQML